MVENYIEHPFGVNIETPYGNVIVQDGIDEISGQPIRQLIQDGAAEAAMFLSPEKDCDLPYDYFRCFDHCFDYTDVKDILMIGGAIYTYPRHVLKYHNNASITVVDINPAMDYIARKYFRFNEIENKYDPDYERFTSVVADGLDFMRETDEKYDAIMIDAFFGLRVNPVFYSVDAAKIILRALSEHGVCMINTIGSINGFQSEVINGVFNSVNYVFPYAYIFNANHVDTLSYGNYMIVGSKDRLRIDYAFDYKEKRSV